MQPSARKTICNMSLVACFLFPSCKIKVRENSAKVKLGGSTAEELFPDSKHPFALGLLSSTDPTLKKSKICTGSNLGAGYVLTAFHCIRPHFIFDQAQKKFSPLDNYTLHIIMSREFDPINGVITPTRGFERQTQVKVQDIYVYPGQTPTAFGSDLQRDFVVVKLSASQDMYFHTGRVSENTIPPTNVKLHGIGLEGLTENGRPVLDNELMKFRLLTVHTPIINSLSEADRNTYFRNLKQELLTSESGHIAYFQGNFFSAENAEMWPGDSGGPALNPSSGEIIGINSVGATAWEDSDTFQKIAYGMLYLVTGYAHDINGLPLGQESSNLDHYTAQP